MQTCAMSVALGGSLICIGKLIYGFNVSVDGHIADARGGIDWAEPRGNRPAVLRPAARRTDVRVLADRCQSRSRIARRCIAFCRIPGLPTS
jgi:hypothetical protein